MMLLIINLLWHDKIVNYLNQHACIEIIGISKKEINLDFVLVPSVE